MNENESLVRATTNTDEESKAGRFAPWATVFILLLLYVLAFLDRQILSLLVDPIKKELGVSDVQMSLLLGLSFGLLYISAGLLMGAIIDRSPRRIVIFAGVA